MFCVHVVRDVNVKWHIMTQCVSRVLFTLSDVPSCVASTLNRKSKFVSQIVRSMIILGVNGNL